MDFGIASVAAITVICYLAGMSLKAWDLFDDRKIPAFMGVLGLLLGLLAYSVKMPDFPASDIITAAAVGIVSGLAATGVNQIVKQAGKEE